MNRPPMPARHALIPDDALYAPSAVAALFDEMASTYGLTNYLSSFGFTHRWRRACVAEAGIRPGATVCDLMSGMGECWPLIGARLGGAGRIRALDISEQMCTRAAARRGAFPGVDIDVLHEDVLANTLGDGSADCVVSAFGLKTFSPAQRARVAAEVARVLRPGGTFSLLEISVPPHPALQLPYLAYLNHVIPHIGRAFLGNPDNYRMLGVYTERFDHCDGVADALEAEGLHVRRNRWFGGCATGVSGHKP